MHARQISIGTELFADRLDTNGPRLAEALADLGLEVVERVTVGDALDDLTRALECALNAGGLIVTTGGLGPTSDDRTREAIAAATGRELGLDESIVSGLEQRAQELGRPTPGPGTLAQAQVPAGARVLENPAGTAPGLLLSFDAAVLLVLPGPPRELAAMQSAALTAAVEALERIGLAPSLPAPAIAELRVAGLGESAVAEKLAGAPSLEALGLELAYLANASQVCVKLRASDQGLVDAAAGAVRERLGKAVFSEQGLSLAEVVVAQLAERFETVGAVESCTGGLISSALTSVPGSSRVLRAGLVVYSNDAKTGLAGVPPALLEAEGAVSEACARALAAGGRRSVQADWVLSVTGIAGPDGGTEEKPVGTVWTAIAGPDGEVRTRLFRFPGDRDFVRSLTVAAMLNGLRLRLLE